MAQLTMQWSLVENQQQTEPLKYDYSISQSNWNYTNEDGFFFTPSAVRLSRNTTWTAGSTVLLEEGT
ncbi:hypothetical protein AnigIFM60653_000058 [Aspergillus niger]|uniref:Uncharacterized protein n=3 Tax=Aspergillus TaxID=5052 RepID=A0A3F3QCI0_9EURO|nr:hypothetical protein BDQ94DRAFT_166981 [Aspergillus welwitschiae]RDH36893.1 hypothetical protein BDQ94DRAFT_166981 [Aspergillus welwitschiae]RDK43541.1 hypothetical protein M752DRAFT_292709 [Aspergillus phoenicis ATCC 13157]TPR11349.1 U1 zinc finger family protein [Aspergillus niger]GKZ98725.1 hypothetical protein AnigIFM60653_000058 [Aspergillus niger]